MTDLKHRPSRAPLPRSPLAWWITLGLAVMTACAALAPQRALANDDALYGPDAPPGSAFIRVFNASDRQDIGVQVGKLLIPDVDAWDVSDFEFLPPGAHTVSGGGVSQQVTLQPDRFYTAVLGPQSVRLLENEPYSNRLKALVILYNLTDAPDVSLRTPDGKTPIIDDVAVNAVGTREVNAARASLALYAADERIADAPPVNLMRGKAFSLFAVGSSAAPRLVWAIN